MELVPLQDDQNLEVEKENATSNTIPNLPIENETATPLTDRHGRDLWVRSRMCFCPDDATTDCRFHNQKEKGWQECPHLELAKKNKHLKGRWLWTRNPLYGKPLTEEEKSANEEAKEAA